MRAYYRAFAAILVISTACTTIKPYYHPTEYGWKRDEPQDTARLAYTVYAIGDCGEAIPGDSTSPLFYLKQFIHQENPDRTAVAFLGDNIYYRGMRDSTHPQHERDISRIEAQIQVVEDFQGKVIFIPGNHDWAQGKPEGLENVRRQEAYITRRLGNDKVFRPENGCSGPESISLTDSIEMLVIDTQWWFHMHEKGQGEEDGCRATNDQEFLEEVRDMILKHRDKKLVILGHHPLASNGTHGGLMPARDHFFPLLAVNRYLWIPLPVLGSIHPLYRKVFGNIQDLPHPRYEQLVDEFTSVFEEHPSVTYVSGHEHNLQYIEIRGAHQVISGSGSKTNYVRGNKKVQFCQQRKGFSKLRYYDNGEIWLDFYSMSSSGDTIQHVWRKQVEPPTVYDIAPHQEPKDIWQDSILTFVPGPEYKAKKVKRAFFGDLNREPWMQEVEVPFLDLKNFEGGVEIEKRGGGLQTNTLRIHTAQGNEYNLRTVKKVPWNLLSRTFEDSFVADVVNDGLAATFPFASSIVPPLSDALGVEYIPSSMVVIPPDSSLGIYFEDFANEICLMEERIKTEEDPHPMYKDATAILSSKQLYSSLRRDNDNQVDQLAFLRARLLDFVIGDWDRHEEQWRWAEYEDGKRKIYKPIPRDRDQVFFKQEGFFPFFLNRPWGQRRFQSFTPDIRDMIGFNYNARFVDRAHLNDLTLQDWLAMADTLQSTLTDSLLEASLLELPPNIHDITHERLSCILKYRRDHLKDFILEYYGILYKTVTVTGSNKNERFIIEADQPGKITISVYRRSNGDWETTPYFHNSFMTAVTKEILIYGLSGEDEFIFKNKPQLNLKIRVIGGDDLDTYCFQNGAEMMRQRFYIYDDNMEVTCGNTRKVNRNLVHSTIKPNQIQYNRTLFHYDYYRPTFRFEYNRDDGIMLGAGIALRKYGFNYLPYKSKQRALLYSSLYETNVGGLWWAHFPQRMGKVGMLVDMSFNAPRHNFPFYGFGNDNGTYDFQSSSDNNFLSLSSINARPHFSLSKREHTIFHFGPSFQYFFDCHNQVVYDNEGTPIFVDVPNEVYAGVGVGIDASSVDSEQNPHRGLRVKLNTEYLNGLRFTKYGFLNTSGSIALYAPMDWLPGKNTLALRAGGGVNWGNIRFYHSQFLGGYSDMRGYRRNRFAGFAKTFFNLEWRSMLFRYVNLFVPSEFGIIGFADVGRVWYSGEKSSRWHPSVGGGIYLWPLRSGLISATWGYGQDGSVITVRFGFLF